MDFLASPHTLVWLAVLCVLDLVLVIIFAGSFATHEWTDRMPRGAWAILLLTSQVVGSGLSVATTMSIILNIIRYAQHR